MIAGDFNFPNIIWDNNSVQVLGSNISSPNSKFVDIINDESLTQNILMPTFLQANSTCVNTLDYVITDDPSRVSSVSIDQPLGPANQGHLLIWYNYHIDNHLLPIKHRSRKFNYKKGRYLEFNDKINSYNWPEMFDKKSIELCYDIFTSIYEKACLEYIPLFPNQTNKKPRPPWMTTHIAKLSRQKRSLFYKNLASRWRYPNLVIAYKSIKKQITTATKHRIAEFELELASDKKNPKKLFSYVNSRQKVTSQINYDQT